MFEPENKRQFRPTDSVQSTADRYGTLHGIDKDTQAQLQNVGRRARQAVNTGARTLQPTQSLPVALQPGTNLFMSDRETRAMAQGIINKEAWRAHELQPMAYTSPSFGPGPDPEESSTIAGLALERDMRLRFGADGGAEYAGVATFNVPGMHGQKRATSGSGFGPKYGSEIEPLSLGGGSAAGGFALPAAPNGVNLPNVSDDFPPVFKSPQLSVPELFGPTGAMGTLGAGRAKPPTGLGSMGPPPLPGADGRATRALPRRTGLGFSRAVSAPVGRFGGFDKMEIEPPAARPAAAGFGVGAMGAMGAVAATDEEEDGFDVGDWAADEE